MKIESRMLIDKETMQKLINADSSVRGTDDYMRYRMEYSFKFFDDEKKIWTKWFHGGFGIPARYNPAWANSGYIIRVRNGNIFIESLQYREGGTNTLTVERYRVTDEVIKLLGWECKKGERK